MDGTNSCEIDATSILDVEDIDFLVHMANAGIEMTGIPEELPPQYVVGADQHTPDDADMLSIIYPVQGLLPPYTPYIDMHIDDSPLGVLPAYNANCPDLQWKIKNVKHSSSFYTNGAPQAADYRAQIEQMRRTIQSCGNAKTADRPQSDSRAHSVDVELSQTFRNIGDLIAAYKVCLEQIGPVAEENILFLLMDRFAKSAHVRVYVEIERPGHMQVYDSEAILPPCFSASNRHADVAYTAMQGLSATSDPNCTDILQHPTASEFQHDPTRKCEVTFNFPELIVSDSDGSTPADGQVSGGIFETSSQEQSAFANGWLFVKRPSLPFRYHQCHHRGVETPANDGTSSSPFGLAEVIQHAFENELAVADIIVQSPEGQSAPHAEGGIQAFECRVSENNTPLYVTVKRQGDALIYNCFWFKEIWSLYHEHHEDCEDWSH